MKDNYEKGELAKEILKGLALGGFIVLCIAMPNVAQVAKLFQATKSKDKYRFDRAMNGLRRKKFIRVYQKGGQDVVEITREGKRKVLEYNIDEMELKRPRRWNGKWHIIIFDIPESKKNARYALNRKVREFGLYPLQKSVLVSPYLCRNEIDFIGEFFGVRDHIIYITADEIEGAEKVKRHFGVFE
ncbi:MAG: hypothetical protein HZB10_03630 [Candidatus Yonathbacteria bacterium]|nr:hypothetical protein [Candidatus Yonathbacteria bacterium]